MFTSAGKKVYISFFLCALLAAALFAFMGTAQEPGKLLISSFEGEVSRFNSESNEWAPVKEGMQLKAGDRIKTGSRSSCEVYLGDTSFRIKEDSLVAVEDVLKKIEMTIEYGSILTRIKNLPPESEFVVKTPEAVIGARGTRYKVFVEKEPRVTYTAVIEKSVTCGALNEPARTVMVKEYKRTEVAPWKTAIIRAAGSGVLSEQILGEEAVKKLKSDISVKSFGDTKEKALRDLAETVNAIQLYENTCLSDILSKNPETLKAVYAYIVESAVISQITQGGKKIFQAELAIDPISKIIKRDIYLISNLVYPVSADEYTKKFGALARVTTRRAAKIDGLRKLAEIIYGTVIDSKTNLEDYVATNDVIRSRVTGIVQGAKEIGEKYFSDGSMSVALEVEARAVKDDLTPIAGDVFGRHYIAKPAVISIEDFEEYLVE